MAADFPAIPLALELKDLGRAHVVVGDLPCHLDFLREILGGQTVAVEHVDTVDDLPLMTRIGQGSSPFIWQVGADRHIALAPDTRKHIHIWSAKPIKKHTAAIRTLARQALGILKAPEPSKEILEDVCDRIIENLGEDASPAAMIWEAVWLLTDPETVGPPVQWTNPWEKPWEFAKADNIAERLNSLYKDLVTYVYAKIEDKPGIERMGRSPKKVQWLKTLSLDNSKVEKALTILSQWRASGGGNDYQTALRVGMAFME